MPAATGAVKVSVDGITPSMKDGRSSAQRRVPPARRRAGRPGTARRPVAPSPSTGLMAMSSAPASTSGACHGGAGRCGGRGWETSGSQPSSSDRSSTSSASPTARRATGMARPDPPQRPGPGSGLPPPPRACDVPWAPKTAKAQPRRGRSSRVSACGCATKRGGSTRGSTRWPARAASTRADRFSPENSGMSVATGSASSARQQRPPGSPSAPASSRSPTRPASPCAGCARARAGPSMEIRHPHLPTARQGQPLRARAGPPRQHLQGPRRACLRPLRQAGEGGFVRVSGREPPVHMGDGSDPTRFRTVRDVWAGLAWLSVCSRRRGSTPPGPRRPAPRRPTAR